MGLFRRKKPKYVEDVLEYDANAQLEQKPPAGKPGKKEKKEAENPAKEYCGQILSAARDLEDSKREYKVVTEYLTDIQKLENLPEEDFSQIQETASKVVALSETRNRYLNRAKTISDAQFAQMEQLSDDMPEIINRLKANESYQAMVQRDMRHLEGEKEEWNYFKEGLEREQGILRKLLYALLGVFAVALLAVLIMGYVMEFDASLPFLLIVLAAGAIGAVLALRLQNDKLDTQRAQLNINRAVMLMNRMKLKYVNITNAVDYACEKYHVRNGYELEYTWQQYLEAVEERKRYERTNDELEYASGKLVRQLQGYQLYDSRIWTYQANALIDKREMVEVKHGLLVRRKKLRSAVEEQVGIIQSVKREILKLLQENPGNEEEIHGLLREVDQLCGLA